MFAFQTQEHLVHSAEDSILNEARKGQYHYGILAKLTNSRLRSFGSERRKKQVLVSLLMFTRSDPQSSYRSK